MALSQHHKLYKWMAQGPGSFDCSGFTYFVTKEIFNIDITKDGYGLSDTTKQMTSKYGNLSLINEKLANIEKIEIIKKNILPGDLLFFHRQSLSNDHPTVTNRYPGHVGIYLGNNSFIHTTSKGKAMVVISRLYEDSYYTGILVGYKNVVDYLYYSEKEIANLLDILNDTNKLYDTDDYYVGTVISKDEESRISIFLKTKNGCMIDLKTKDIYYANMINEQRTVKNLKQYWIVIVNWMNSLGFIDDQIDAYFSINEIIKCFDDLPWIEVLSSDKSSCQCKITKSHFY